MSERAPRGKFNWGIERVFEHFYFPHMEEVRLEFEPRVLMILMDARPIAEDRLQRFAQRLMDAGVIFFVCWGPGCKRMHDAADWARSAETLEALRRGEDPEEVFEARNPIIMTTYHYPHDEEVEQTAEFWCRFCYPPAAWGPVRTWTSVVIGNEEWHDRLVHHIETRPLSRLERGLSPEPPGEETE
ncbi:DUF7684 family protein [Fimbriimonas ginsengisoli]|uniref:DUF7684 domain-containing protein n=1 Tax=Fimbriimonas ginsengisoli Gsoil 348 TaxID=661478 RepID=A0A068NKR3_FIMGI|nr:hypothetical protein [Fimbriimonas ginsengisoli]AIE84022.1 hypothetical protein OP10G_0654 [Fimbriimonas ginsengisoli Gsoil 348]